MISKDDQKAHYTVRDIRIKLGNESRTVKQMQYHSWPDHGVPGKSIKKILKSKKFLKSKKNFETKIFFSKIFVRFFFRRSW